MVELEVHESQHGDVEFSESTHHLYVYVVRFLVAEMMRDEPSDHHAANVGLVIVTLNRDENFPQASGVHDVMHELHRQSLAHGHILHVGHLGVWEPREEETHAERVVQVPDGILERRISAGGNFILGVMLADTVGPFAVILVDEFAEFPGVDLELAELVEHRFVKKELDVFTVVECLGCICGAAKVNFLLVFWLVRINAFQYADSPVKT